MNLTHGRAAWLMVGATLLWSTAGVVTRHLQVAQAFEVTFWRSAFNAASLLVLLPLLRGRAVWVNLLRCGWMLWASGLCWAGMFTFFMVALMLTTVAQVLVTMALGPLLTALVARLTIGHRVAPRTWVAMAVAGAGIAAMYADQLGHGGGVLGTVVALGVPASAAANWTVMQHVHARGAVIDLLPAVWIGAVLSSLITWPLAWPLQANAHDMLLLAGLGLGQLAVPCVLAVVSTRHLSAPEVALLGLLEVIFGILLAWVGAGEAPAAQVLLGGALVIGALLANEILAWRGRA